MGTAVFLGGGGGGGGGGARIIPAGGGGGGGGGDWRLGTLRAVGIRFLCTTVGGSHYRNCRGSRHLPASSQDDLAGDRHIVPQENNSISHPVEPWSRMHLAVPGRIAWKDWVHVKQLEMSWTEAHTHIVSEGLFHDTHENRSSQFRVGLEVVGASDGLGVKILLGAPVGEQLAMSHCLGGTTSKHKRGLLVVMQYEPGLIELQ
eukprot:gene6081-biopygen13076